MSEQLTQSDECQTAYDFASQFMADHSAIFEEVLTGLPLDKATIGELREAVLAYGNACDHEAFRWGFKLGRVLREMTAE